MEAFMLRIALNRKATPGVRIVAQPFPESYWEVVPREALKPGAKGMMPLGPASFVVAEAVLLPTISLADPLARACASASVGRKTSERVKVVTARCRRRTVHNESKRRLLN
jgi:hypothetical protein